MGYKIIERAVRYRLQRLEKDNMILGYSAILNPKFVSEKINRTIIHKFKFSHNISILTERLKNYVEQISFCIYSASRHRIMNNVDNHYEVSEIKINLRSYSSDTKYTYLRSIPILFMTCCYDNRKIQRLYICII